MAFRDAFDNLRSWSDGLSDRERRLLGAMAVVATSGCVGPYTGESRFEFFDRDGQIGL